MNFTTITRAYAEAHRRGFLTATVGRGTFVADPGARTHDESPRAFQDHDLSVNAPPVPAWLNTAFNETVAGLASDGGSLAQSVLTYSSRLGDAGARQAGANWLRWRGIEAETGRVVVTGGAQHALSLVLSTFVKPGEYIVTEQLAYPGLLNAAALARVRIAAVGMDDHGMRAEDLDAVCQRVRPKMLFCVPTLQNPTAAVMSLERRRDILAVARRHQVRVVEDDICGALYPDAVPLAALAPDEVIHIASLSKCVAPGLRTAFALLPSTSQADRLTATLRTSLLMLSPLPLAVATTWIADGVAQKAVADIRQETTIRAQMARRILGDECLVAPPGSLHGWLRLPASTTLASFVAQAQQQGVRVAPADWYVTRGDATEAIQVPNAARVTLGAEQDRSRLEHALRVLASILDQPEALRASSL